MRKENASRRVFGIHVPLGHFAGLEGARGWWARSICSLLEHSIFVACMRATLLIRGALSVRRCLCVSSCAI